MQRGFEPSAKLGGFVNIRMFLNIFRTSAVGLISCIDASLKVPLKSFIYLIITKLTLMEQRTVAMSLSVIFIKSQI